MICTACGQDYVPPKSRPDWPKCERCTLYPKAAMKAIERQKHILRAVRRKRAHQ